MSFPHPHYRRHRRMAQSRNDRFSDSRQKWWMRFDGVCEGDNDSERSILVDPHVWARWQNHPFFLTVLPRVLSSVPPIHLQEGPTCGLYALKMIQPALEVAILLYQARSLGFTERGEMFCVHEMAELARRNGLNAEALPIESILQRAHQQEGVVMIPYDSDVSGISYRRGENAHWGVIWQLCALGDGQTTEWVGVMSHSSMVLPAVESWTELIASNAQLVSAVVDLENGLEDHLEACCLRGWAVWIS